MLQARFFHLLFFGLVTSLTIYNHHFVGKSYQQHRRFEWRNYQQQTASISPPAHPPPASGTLHVLVTNGAGFAGAHLAKTLLEAGHAVTLVDENVSVSHLYRLLTTGPRLKLLSGDLADERQLAAAFRRAQPPVDVVVQLEPSDAEELAAAEPLGWLSNSTSQLLSLLKAMNGTHNVNKLVLASSYSVYDGPATAPVTEDAPTCQPLSTHGQAALFREGAVRSFAAARPQFRAAILRHSSSIIGTDQAQLGRLLVQSSSSSASASSRGGAEGHSDAISGCLAAALQGRQQQQLELPVLAANTDGSTLDASAGDAATYSEAPCLKEYVHVADLAAGFLAVIQENCLSNPPLTYNLGSEPAVSQAKLLEACERLLQGQPQAYGAEGPVKQVCNGVVGNTSKLQVDTGWRPRHTLDNLLADAVRQAATAEGQQQR